MLVLAQFDARLMKTSYGPAKHEFDDPWKHIDVVPVTRELVVAAADLA